MANTELGGLDQELKIMEIDISAFLICKAYFNSTKFFFKEKQLTIKNLTV